MKMKTCSRCRVEKPLDEFHRETARVHLDGRQNNCKQCAKAGGRGRTYIGGRVPPPLTKVCSKCGTEKPIAAFHRKTNAKDGYRNECGPCRVVAVKEWQRANPERVKEINSRRRATDSSRAYHRVATSAYRARKANAFVEDVDHWTVYERDGGICAICCKSVPPSRYGVDHRIPLSRGGEHSYANVQLVHPRCNSRKWAFLPEDMVGLGIGA